MQRILTILFIALASCAYAQDYTVIHVRGEIFKKSSDTPIKRGDRVGADEEIIFKSPNAVAAVLSPSRGRYILKPQSNSGSTNDLFYVLSSIVTPVRGRMSTRAGGINNSLDFRNFFGNQFAFVGDQLKIQISSVSYPQNDSSFFYIQYQYDGEAINKKLGNDNDNLIIDRVELFKIDSSPVEVDKISDYMLYYFDGSQETSKAITPIPFVMVSSDEFKDLVNGMTVDGEQPGEEDVFNLVSEFYGKCQMDNIRLALSSLK